MSPNQTSDGLAKEVLKIGAEIETRLKTLQVLCMDLTRLVKRSELDANSQIYIRFSSVWARYAGLSLQAINRSNGVGRLLNRTVASNQAEQQAALEVKAKPRPLVNKTSPIEDLLSMYSNAQEDGDNEPYRTRKPDAPRK